MRGVGGDGGPSTEILDMRWCIQGFANKYF